MNSELRKLLNEERKRVFEPGPYFPQRVVARWKERSRDAGIWEIVPTAARPVFALALTLLLAFLTLEAFVPVTPTRSMIEAFLEAEQTAAESFLYADSDTPESHHLLEQLIVLEEGEE